MIYCIDYQSFNIWNLGTFVALTPLKKGIFQCLKPNLTLTLMITFNLFIFSNSYRSWRLSVGVVFLVFVLHSLELYIYHSTLCSWYITYNLFAIMWNNHINSYSLFVFLLSAGARPFRSISRSWKAWIIFWWTADDSRTGWLDLQWWKVNFLCCFYTCNVQGGRTVWSNC